MKFFSFFLFSFFLKFSAPFLPARDPYLWLWSVTMLFRNTSTVFGSHDIMADQRRMEATFTPFRTLGSPHRAYSGGVFPAHSVATAKPYVNMVYVPEINIATLEISD